MAPTSTIVHITASTHFPIKLTSTNFPVWRKQIESTLTGLELDHFLTESNPPKKLIAGKDEPTSNPDYLPWYRQDQVIISAILGSLSDPIQPLISSAVTAHEAWDRLNSRFASASRSRIISLKSKLVKNPKGNRTISEYLQDMRSIADDLALAQSPVSEEDLLVHILSQLGEEYGSIVAAIKIRETPLSYPELFDKLLDFERALKEVSPPSDSFPATINYTAKQQGRPSYQQGRPSDGSNPGSRTSRFSHNSNNSRRDSRNQPAGSRSNRGNAFCQFCNIPGHNTTDCRKLTRFLRDNNISIANNQSPSPVANVTTTNSHPQWLFDSGASNHVTSSSANLHNVSEYGGPDEIILGDASKEWGFFQVINHGISESLLDDFKREVLTFFNLPMEEKQKLWQEEDNHEGFGQLFVVSEEQKLDWCDMFFITTRPHNLRISELFQNLPPILREKLEAYSVELKKLAKAILGQMAKALGMELEEMTELFEDGRQTMRMNYYPPCPEPELALGLSPHSDANALTILFQLNETAGLQVRKNGEWVSVKPLPNALVVNIGDSMEIISNGVYKSIEHRAIVESNKGRLSVATFHSSNMGKEVGPARSLVGEHNVANYRRVPLEEYYKGFFARKLDGKSNLDFMKLEDLNGKVV